MENAKIQAFAKRYTAALINTAPPNEVDLSSEGFTPEEREAVYRALNQIRERMIVEAEVLESL